MPSFAEVEKKVLGRITPTEKQREEIEGIKNKVMQAAKGMLKNTGIDYTLAGSLLRNTYMVDKKEFDIFFLFPENIDRKVLEKQGLQMGKRLIKKMKGTYRVAYAEHPYVRGHIDGFEVDIVPAYKVKSATEIKSAVDRTPFHNRWLMENLKKEMIPEVRLLKQLLKANGLYGSDAKTEGFSGYLCEVLIVHYGSFENLVREAMIWKPQVVADIQRHSKLNPSQHFKNQPLVVIDPVDPERNVASALSPANLVRFCYGCRQLVSKPSINAFFRRPEHADMQALMKRRGTTIFAIEFPRPDVIDDTLYPQLRKTAGRMADILEENDFAVMSHTMYAGSKCYMVFEMLFPRLPSVKKLEGPPIFAGKNAENFANKYRSSGRVFVEGINYTAEIRRKFLTPEQKTRDSLDDSLKILLAKGFASHIAKAIKKGYRILDSKHIAAACRKDMGLGEHLEDFFTREFW